MLHSLCWHSLCWLLWSSGFNTQIVQSILKAASKAASKAVRHPFNVWSDEKGIQSGRPRGAIRLNYTQTFIYTSKCSFWMSSKLYTLDECTFRPSTLNWFQMDALPFVVNEYYMIMVQVHSFSSHSYDLFAYLCLLTN